MRKPVISCLIKLTALLLTALFLPVCGLASGTLGENLPAFDQLIPESAETGYFLKISADGMPKRAVHVLRKNGHCYIPVETLEEITCYVHDERSPDVGLFVRRTQYSHVDAPYYFVSYDGEEHRLTMKIGEAEYDYDFDGILTEDGIRYLPMDQILPFLHVQWELKDDTLIIKNDPWSLYDVLADQKELIFQLDDIIDGGFFESRAAQIANYIIDALMQFRIEYFIPAYDETNGLSGSQGIHDNIESVVRGYLGDDSAYVHSDGSLLTAGNGYLYDLQKEDAKQTAESLKELKQKSSDIKKWLKRMKMDDLGKQLDELHLEEVLTMAQAQEFCGSMLTDHYRMLDSMFNFSGTHSGKVSENYYADVSHYVYDEYASTWSAMIRCLENNQIAKILKSEKSALTGMLLTSTEQAILKVVSEAVKLFTNADEWSVSMVKSSYHDVFARMACERIEELMKAGLTCENLEDIRLCTLMMLTASRQGFDELASFFDQQPGDYGDAVEVFRNQAKQIIPYQQILYICFNTIERDTPDLCAQSAEELGRKIQEMVEKYPLYTFDPFSFSGIEITLEKKGTQNGVTHSCFRLTGGSKEEDYDIRLPMFETGNREQNQWLWNEMSGQIYSELGAMEKSDFPGFFGEERDENFKDYIQTYYNVSTAAPGALSLYYRCIYTPGMEPGNYTKAGQRLVSLSTHEDLELYQLFNISPEEIYRINDFYKGLRKAIIYSDDYQAYCQGRPQDMLSKPYSLALWDITEEGLEFVERNPRGVGNYAAEILVPWNMLPFERNEYTEVFDDRMIEYGNSGIEDKLNWEQYVSFPTEVEWVDGYLIREGARESDLSRFAMIAVQESETYEYPYDDVLLPKHSLSPYEIVYLMEEPNQYEPFWCQIMTGEGSGYVRCNRIYRIAQDDLAYWVSKAMENGDDPAYVLEFGGVTLESLNGELQEDQTQENE